MYEKKGRYIVEFQDIPKARQHHIEIDVDERRGNYKEVELRFDEERALGEAKRCLSCRRCLGCALCWAECKPEAIDFDMQDEYFDLEADGRGHPRRRDAARLRAGRRRADRRPPQPRLLRPAQQPDRHVGAGEGGRAGRPPPRHAVHLRRGLHPVRRAHALAAPARAAQPGRDAHAVEDRHGQLRIGFLAAAPAIVTELEKLRMPYNLGALNQRAAVRLLPHQREWVSARARDLLAVRERLAAALRGFAELKVFPSEANLLLVRVGKAGDGRATAVWKALAARGILVRNFDRPGPLAGCLRITPGTAAENDLLLAELPAALAAR